jgi:hypothetical protein
MKMQRTALAIAAAVLLAGVARMPVQAAADNFSGTWKYDQAQSGRGTSGNGPAVSFPTDMIIKHTATALNLETSSSRQDVTKTVYKLGGPAVTVPGPSGTTLKGKAKMNGAALVIDSTRSFSSPAGPITNTINEIYTLSGATLSVEKTVTTGGVVSTGKAIYTKVP